MPARGVRTAATVTFSDSGLVVVTGANVQAALGSVDAAFAGLAAGVAGAVAAAAEALGLGEVLDARTRLLGASFDAVTVANTVAESTVVEAPTVLPGALGSSTTRAGDVLRLVAFGSLLNDSGAPVTFLPRVKLGALTIAGAAVAQATDPDPAPWGLSVDLYVRDVDDVLVAVEGRQGAPGSAGGFGARDVGPMDGLGSGVGTDDLLDEVPVEVSVEMGTADPDASFTVAGWAISIAKGPAA